MRGALGTLGAFLTGLVLGLPGDQFWLSLTGGALVGFALGLWLVRRV